jgi:hypothetical protein
LNKKNKIADNNNNNNNNNSQTTSKLITTMKTNISVIVIVITALPSTRIRSLVTVVSQKEAKMITNHQSPQKATYLVHPPPLKIAKIEMHHYSPNPVDVPVLPHIIIQIIVVETTVLVPLHHLPSTVAEIVHLHHAVMIERIPVHFPVVLLHHPFLVVILAMIHIHRRQTNAIVVILEMIHAHRVPILPLLIAIIETILIPLYNLLFVGEDKDPVPPLLNLAQVLAHHQTVVVTEMTPIHVLRHRQTVVVIEMILIQDLHHHLPAHCVTGMTLVHVLHHRQTVVVTEMTPIQAHLHHQLVAKMIHLDVIQMIDHVHHLHNTVADVKVLTIHLIIIVLSHVPRRRQTVVILVMILIHPHLLNALHHQIKT